MTEDEMVGWHHRLNGHEFEQALGVGDGQGGLAPRHRSTPSPSHPARCPVWAHRSVRALACACAIACEAGGGAGAGALAGVGGPLLGFPGFMKVALSRPYRSFMLS